MSLDDLYAAQQAAHDALVAAGLASGARVRLRRSAPHPASLSMWTVAHTSVDARTRQIARVRFDNVVRNQWRTLIPRDLDQLEVKVGARFVPFAELRKGGA